MTLDMTYIIAILLLPTLMLSIAVSAVEAAALCGDSGIPYSERTQMCCSGMVFGRNTSFIICCQDRIFGLGDPSAKQYWDCCGDQAFDTRYQECHGGRPQARLVTESQDNSPRKKTTTTTPYPPGDYYEPTEEYVDAWTPPPTQPARLPIRRTRPTTPPYVPPPTTKRRYFPPRTTAAPPPTFAPTTARRYPKPRRTEPPVDEPPRTCLDRAFNPDTQVCCGGYVYVRSTPTVLCCAGALFAVGEPEGERFWACCDHTIFDRRRQICSANGIVLQRRRDSDDWEPAVTTATSTAKTTTSTTTTTTRPPTTTTTTQLRTTARTPFIPRIITVPRGPPSIDMMPQTLPPPTFGATVSGYITIHCKNGKVMQVRNTGEPKACCGGVLYDSSQQVCLGDQYTIHKSLVPGLPNFFVSNILNETTPATWIRTTTPTTTSTTTPTTTTQKEQVLVGGLPESSLKMEISCNGNNYQIPLSRLDKVACCGQYLYDSRYYRCLNGAVIAINSLGKDVTVAPPTTKPQQRPQKPQMFRQFPGMVDQRGPRPPVKEYVTSLPFVHSFFPASPGLPMPIQPRSYGRSLHTTSQANLRGEAPYVLPDMNSFVDERSDFHFPNKGQVSDTIAAVLPKPMPSFPVAESDLGSMPYVPSWRPQTGNAPKANVGGSLPQQQLDKPADTYRSQLSMWNNQFPPTGDYEPNIFGLDEKQSSADSIGASLPAPVVQVAPIPLTTPSFEDAILALSKTIGNKGIGENWIPPVSSSLKSSFPGFIPPPSLPKKPVSTNMGAALPKPIGTIESFDQPEPVHFPFSINNWPSPTSFENRPIPDRKGPPPHIPDNYRATVNDDIKWPDFIRAPEPVRSPVKPPINKPVGAFLMTPVIPIDSKPFQPATFNEINAINLMQNNSSRLPFKEPLSKRSQKDNDEETQTALPMKSPPGKAKKIVTDGKCQAGRLVQAPSKDQDFIYCCENTPYDIRSQFCCGGTVEEWLSSDDGRIFQLCCDGVYIYNVNGDPNVQCCGRTAINTKYEPCSSVSF